MVRPAYAKNGESRSVSMNAVLTTTLWTVRMNIFAATGLVFCSRNNTSYRYFWTAFERAVCRAGIDGLVFHDLRHTFASRLVMRGVDLLIIQSLMGHKEISMTLRSTHLTTDHKQHAVRMLEDFQE
jgi:site-specific recombinase XerD